MISIIIPVFNSENTIEILVNNIVKILGEYYKFEIILINDSSVDSSEEKCKKLVEKYSNVVLYSLSKNVGEHNTVMAGLNKCSGDYAVIMDDDLQHSVDSLLELIKFGIKEKNNFDVVYTYYDKMKYNFYRNFGRKFNDLLANPKDTVALSKYKDTIIKYDVNINKLILERAQNNINIFI